MHNYIIILILLTVLYLLLEPFRNNDLLEPFGLKIKNPLKKLDPFKPIKKWIKKMGKYILLIFFSPLIFSVLVLIIYGIYKAIKKN